MPSSFSAFVLSLALVFTLHGLSASAHAAAGSGIHVDPDSAPAHEYALPLDAAREVGAGSATRGPSKAAARPPAFGAGITPKAAATSRRSHPGEAARSGVGDNGRRSAKPEATQTPSGPDARERDSASSNADDDSAGSGASSGGGGTAVLYSLGAAIVVLGAGGLVALTLRRRQPSV